MAFSVTLISVFMLLSNRTLIVVSAETVQEKSGAALPQSNLKRLLSPKRNFPSI